MNRSSPAPTEIAPLILLLPERICVPVPDLVSATITFVPKPPPKVPAIEEPLIICPEKVAVSPLCGLMVNVAVLAAAIFAKLVTTPSPESVRMLGERALAASDKLKYPPASTVT